MTKTELEKARAMTRHPGATPRALTRVQYQFMWSQLAQGVTLTNLARELPAGRESLSAMVKGVVYKDWYAATSVALKDQALASMDSRRPRLLQTPATQSAGWVLSTTPWTIVGMAGLTIT